ncbi:MAG: hypothetical protein HQ567_06450, partial [Candidatus Nealsonbacteria bacterium]|nr:hypothetical protein [Candidatus Nealsonbacteria bacterium]
SPSPPAPLPASGERGEAAKPPAADGDDYFLAQQLYNQANDFLQANEMLALLDRLKPVYECQPPRLFAMKRWIQARIQYLQNTGQLKESLALHRQLAEGYPRDAGLQTEFADALARRGEYKAAYAWLDRTMADKAAKWGPQEWDTLRNTRAHWLRNQGRYTELSDFLANWVKQNPGSLYAYQQYLSALVRTDREDDANKLVERWIRDARVPVEEEARDGDKLTTHEASRLSAAVSFALGQGYNLHSNRIEERWLDPLAETAWFFARHKTQYQIAVQIMGHGQFRQTDQCRAIRKRALGVLLAEIDRMAIVEIERFVGWVRANDPAVEKPAWQRLADGLAKRWDAAKDPDEKNRFAGQLIQILSGHVGAKEHLAFLRRQLQQGPKRDRIGYVRQLFDALLAQPWTQQHEDEAFGLVEQLSDAKEPTEKLATEVQALYRLTDAMLQGRYNALMAKVANQHELTRIELRDKQAENLKAAREAYSARLRRAVGEHSDSLGPWLRIERLYIETLLGRELDRVAQGCWELLGPKPTPPPEKPGPDYALRSVLQGRCLATLANLAARRSAEKADVDRLLQYVDRAIALDLKRDAKNIGWKSLKYQLLIALDRPKELEKELADWVRPDQPDGLWRRALAYLLAERGEIAPAIDHFKLIEAADELSPGDYRTLADWYMVVDQRKSHEQALRAALKTTQEWQLNQYLSQKLNPWQQSEGHLPSELDKQVIHVFAVLFEKSGSPSRYLRQLAQFYKATHDFRLLGCLADGVIGHTAGKVYPFLGGMQSVLSEIRDEATADSVVEHLAEVRKRAKTDVDRRALDLLETQVERRAAELLNQPGPHIDAALAALKRAFEHEWSDGEPRLMADFLATLGQITPESLAAEQVRQLEVLHERAKRGSEDRLHIARSLARSLWSYSRHDEAIDLLAAALTEFEEASGGTLPASANGAIGSLISYLETRHHFTRGERFLQDQLAHPANPQQTLWLTLRLYELYEAAIARSGEVSLGGGATLFQAVVGKIQDDMATDDNNHRHALVVRLCSIYRTAHSPGVPGVVDSLKAFASGRLPAVLRRQTDNYQSMVVHVAGTLYTLASPRDGLAFLIERIEQEPSWLRYTNQDGWSRHASQFARWRIEVGALGDLKPRLLAIVLAELRRDLRYRQSRNREMYHKGHTRFWSEVRSAYAQTAEEVYAERKRSGAAVQYIAEYLYHGLDLYDRAVEILLIAHHDKLLDEGGQAKLVDFLQGTDDYGESIAVLLPLVELRPDRLTYRVELMRAYFHSKRPAQLGELLSQTDEHFHQQGRWTENAMNQLAYGCLRVRLFKESAGYYEEAIKLRQRTAPNRGIGDGTLSNYYKYQGEAYAGAGNTAKAVEAACGAVVSWGPTHGNRASALRNLERVLDNAPDLDDYVATLDREAAASKQDKPIVRKALGRVYRDKRQYAKAAAQLKLAVELQPNDRETHKALIDCYDRQNDRQGAIRQTLASLQLSRRDIELYKKLAERFEQLEQAEDSERAYTSIVEMQPSESESHAMLAKIRQIQDRWEDAAAHWRQVAEIRKLEPTGLLNLAAALVHLEQWDEAQQTLKKLRARGWPSRFDEELRQLPELERAVEKGRG